MKEPWPRSDMRVLVADWSTLGSPGGVRDHESQSTEGPPRGIKVGSRYRSTCGVARRDAADCVVHLR